MTPNDLAAVCQATGRDAEAARLYAGALAIKGTAPRACYRLCRSRFNRQKNTSRKSVVDKR